MELSFADKIWNRACGYYPSPVTDLHEGDLALRALLSLHGLTINGGVFHPFDVLSQDEIAEAVRAYRYYGLDPVADVFIRAGSLIETRLELGSFERVMGEEYSVHIPNDRTLVQVFEHHLAEHPELYAPL
jgi:hypothetical protein